MFRVGGVIPLVAALSSLLLAVLVYRRAPDRRVGRTFALLALTLVFWNLNFFALYAFRDYEVALALSRVFRTGAVFVLPAILHLSLVLPGGTLSRGWRRFLWIDYSCALVLAGLNVAGILVNHLESFTWGYYSVGTRYYNLFTVSVITNFSLGALVLIQHYWTTQEARMRAQLRFWLFGMAVALPLGLTNLLPPYGVHFYPLGNLGSAVWAGIVGYAIARHRLMDIEIVVTKGLSHTLGVLLVVGPAICVTLILQQLAFGEIHYDFSAALALLFVAIGILFPPMQQYAEGRLEQALFRSKFESRAAVASLASEVVKVLDRKQLTTLLCERMGEAFALDRVALFLREEVRGGFELFGEHGTAAGISRFEGSSSLVRWLTIRREAVLRDESLDARRMRGAEAAGDPPFPAHWVVCLPFVNGPDLLGFMLLGHRRALQDYSAGDLALLNEVAVGAGIALQNARLYEELRRSREIINRAGRLSALGTLAAGIAHEVRNPLVSIQTFFQLAPGRLDDEEFMTSFLKLAETEVQRISNLITELLTLAKSPSPSLEEIDLSDIAERTITLLEPQARSQGVRLEFRAIGELPKVSADADRIMQVVLNLGLNAIQATQPGGLVVLEAREVSLDGTSFCEIEVSDTGRGIPAEVRESIFDPFFTTKETGSGLGLAIAHQIVAEAGGFISVESVEGSGSRFGLHLPAGFGPGMSSGDTPRGGFGRQRLG